VPTYSVIGHCSEYIQLSLEDEASDCNQKGSCMFENTGQDNSFKNTEQHS